MTLLKETLGALAFIAGLVIIIGSAQKDKSIWWWMVGAGILFGGLDAIIDAKIKNAKEEISEDIYDE